MATILGLLVVNLHSYHENHMKNIISIGASNKMIITYTNMDSTIYNIYLITCIINNKKYVGFTSKTLDFRMKVHIQKSEKVDVALYRAARKYGWNNFKWSVLYQSLDGKHCKNVMEPHFIREYDSIKNGYNMTSGGEGFVGYMPPPEVIQKRADGISYDWIVTEPNGNRLQVRNLKKFCRENSLDASQMVKVSKGRQKQHQNYLCERV